MTRNGNVPQTTTENSRVIRPLNESHPIDKSAALVVIVRDANKVAMDVNRGRIEVSSELTTEAWVIQVVACSKAKGGEKGKQSFESYCSNFNQMLPPIASIADGSIQAIFFFRSYGNSSIQAIIEQVMNVKIGWLVMVVKESFPRFPLVTALGIFVTFSCWIANI